MSALGVALLSCIAATVAVEDVEATESENFNCCKIVNETPGDGCGVTVGKNVGKIGNVEVTAEPDAEELCAYTLFENLFEKTISKRRQKKNDSVCFMLI